MTPEELKKHFKTGYAFYKKTGMSHNSFENWIKWGFVPYLSQKKIEKITNGLLKAEWEDRDESTNS